MAPQGSPPCRITCCKESCVREEKYNFMWPAINASHRHRPEYAEQKGIQDCTNYGAPFCGDYILWEYKGDDDDDHDDEKPIGPVKSDDAASFVRNEHSELALYVEFRREAMDGTLRRDMDQIDRDYRERVIAPSIIQGPEELQTESREGHLFEYVYESDSHEASTASGDSTISDNAAEDQQLATNDSEEEDMSEEE